MTKIRVPADNLADREFLTVDTDLAIAAGAWNGVTKVNKFGYAPDGVQTTATDIWDRADAATTQQIWNLPGVATGSNPYNIVSTSASDLYLALTGASILTIWGLPDWDSKEISEEIQLNGTTPVQTANEYVAIHRMSVTSYGTIGVNVGTITATKVGPGAQIVAQINPGWGQTEMAIYAIPSIQSAYLTNWYASIQKASGVAVDVNFKLMYSQDPENSNDLFVTKEIRGLQSTGSSNGLWEHRPYKNFTGPGILKVQAIGSAADIDCTAGFDLILLDN